MLKENLNAYLVDIDNWVVARLALTKRNKLSYGATSKVTS